MMRQAIKQHRCRARLLPVQGLMPRFYVQQELITSGVRRNEMRKGTVPKRQYTDEFKIEAIRLSDSVGGHEAARRLGIPLGDVEQLRMQAQARGLGVFA